MKWMKSTILRLIFISELSFHTVGSSNFHLITSPKTYEQAKRYCRDIYDDLATVHNSTDMDNLNRNVLDSVDRAWIGLEMGNVWRWRWSRPDQAVDFLNWRSGQPENKDEAVCAAMDEHGKWFQSDCGIKRRFICHGETGDHVFVTSIESWRNAQKHCRNTNSDLVSVNSAEENEAVHNLSVSETVWIGLFKDPWEWSDGSNSSFRYWKPFQPNYTKNQNCAVAVFKDGGKWNNLRCSSKHNFICRGESKPTPAPTTHTTITASSDVIATPHFTLSSTKEQNTINITTPPQNTNSSPISTVTATQPPPASTVHSSVTPLGNLVLIQQNVTWLEAVTYCRMHHIDIVHITTKHIQEEVAEKVKNATSSHVWLGLRYTCDFGFWFWTKSTTACYQNWAPGQGPEGNYNCGITGAIEATGGQQWFGLPETEKLNFICHTCGG